MLLISLDLIIYILINIGLKTDKNRISLSLLAQQFTDMDCLVADFSQLCGRLVVFRCEFWYVKLIKAWDFLQDGFNISKSMYQKGT